MFESRRGRNPWYASCHANALHSSGEGSPSVLALRQALPAVLGGRTLVFVRVRAGHASSAHSSWQSVSRLRHPAPPPAACRRSLLLRKMPPEALPCGHGNTAQSLRPRVARGHHARAHRSLAEVAQGHPGGVREHRHGGSAPRRVRPDHVGVLRARVPAVCTLHEAALRSPRTTVLLNSVSRSGAPPEATAGAYDRRARSRLKASRASVARSTLVAES